MHSDAQRNWDACDIYVFQRSRHKFRCLSHGMMRKTHFCHANAMHLDTCNMHLTGLSIKLVSERMHLMYNAYIFLFLGDDFSCPSHELLFPTNTFGRPHLMPDAYLGCNFCCPTHAFRCLAHCCRDSRRSRSAWHFDKKPKLPAFVKAKREAWLGSGQQASSFLVSS